MNGTSSFAARKNLPRFIRYTAIMVVMLGSSSISRADWPMARHDPRRTATASDTPAGITKPVPYWHYYLGGTLYGSSHFALDINQDGKVEVIYSTGGKVIAKLPDDTMVWESPTVEIHSLIGVDDLNGDGTLDIVAYSMRQAFVLSGKTGEIQWAEPEGEMGTISKVLLGDLDGDQRADLYIQECGCCGLNSGSPGVAYRFAAGFKVNQPFWVAPAHGSCNGTSNVLADFDGDGTLDLGYVDYSLGMSMIKGSDGTVLGVSESVGTRTDAAYCDTANVDGRSGDEMICFQSRYQASGATGGHQVWAATYDPQANPKIKILWRHTIENQASGSLIWDSNSLKDLDGDGKWEVVVSEFNGTSWTTKIYDAVSGTTLTTTPDQILRQIVDLDGDTKYELIYSSPGNQDLIATKFRRAPTPALESLWTLKGGYNTLAQKDWSKVRRTSVDDKPLTIDLNADQTPELILFKSSTETTPAELIAFKAGKKESPTPIATYKVPEGLSILTQGIFSKLNRSYDQIVITLSNGFLIIFDNELQSTNHIEEVEYRIPGMRIGGYYSGDYGFGEPAIAPKDTDSGDLIIVADSRGSLIRLNMSGASMISPPKVLWQIANGIYPTYLDKIVNEKPGFVCAKRSTANLFGFSLEGKQLWQTPLPGIPVYDAVPGDVNGDGTQEIFAEYYTQGAVANVQVFNSTTGTSIWTNPYVENLSWGAMPFAVADYDDDGKADLYAIINSLKIFKGETGSRLAGNDAFLAYFLPTVEDSDFDGATEIMLSGGFYPIQLFKKSSTNPSEVNPVWTSKDDDRPYPFGARATCPQKRSIWVQSSLKNPGQVRLMIMNGSEMGTNFKTLYLAGGALFADAASARNAGKFLGTVGNATIKPNLVGANTHPSALLGSTDGWLYAINACDGTLDWSLNFRFPVGEAIFADTNGDGADEIVVSVADGYLYGLSQQKIAAPAYVYDTDPPNGITDRDVDTITTYNTLYAVWGLVAEADSYEAAVITPGGSYISQPNWKNVGKLTSTSFTGLPLVNGKKYLVAVRAISQKKGASIEMVSNGVVVKTADPKPILDGGHPDAGGIGGDSRLDGGGSQSTTIDGCSCHVGEQRTTAQYLHLLWSILFFLIYRHRKKNSSACRNQ